MGDDLGPKIEGAANCVFPNVVEDKFPRFISKSTEEDYKKYEEEMAYQQRLIDAGPEMFNLLKMVNLLIEDLLKKIEKR